MNLNINYIGADIVESIIKNNILKYSSELVSFTKLRLIDIIQDK